MDISSASKTSATQICTEEEMVEDVLRIDIIEMSAMEGTRGTASSLLSLLISLFISNLIVNSTFVCVR